MLSDRAERSKIGKPVAAPALGTRCIVVPTDGEIRSHGNGSFLLGFPSSSGVARLSTQNEKEQPEKRNELGPRGSGKYNVVSAAREVSGAKRRRRLAGLYRATRNSGCPSGCVQVHSAPVMRLFTSTSVRRVPSSRFLVRARIIGGRRLLRNASLVTQRCFSVDAILGRGGGGGGGEEGAGLQRRISFTKHRLK